jgi:hypothetical protein
MEYYKKVFIKSKAGLPKKLGDYWIKWKKDGEKLELHSFEHGDIIDAIWNDCIDWYFQPIELPTEPIMSAEDTANKMSSIIKSYAEHLFMGEETVRVLRGKWLQRAEQEIGELIIQSHIAQHITHQVELPTDEEIEKLLGQLLYGQYAESQIDDYLARKRILDEWMRDKFKDK